MFLYADGLIQWTTSVDSGGVMGLGGTAAQAGYNAGDGVLSATVPGSRTTEIINITLTSNIGRPGVWAFRVDTEACSNSGEGAACMAAWRKQICNGQEEKIICT